jgi:hypothetical protein
MRDAVTLLALLGAPVVVFVIANVIRSNSLAMIAGLSLMILVAAAVPVGLGFLVGTIAAGRARGRDNESPASAQPVSAQPVSQQSAPRQPSQFSAQRRGLFFVAAAVGSASWIALAIGFILHDQPVPTELDGGLLPAALVFVVTMTIGVRALWQRRRVRLRNEQRDVLAEHRERVAAYERDPNAVACCVHLAPIESAMRAAGVRVEPGGQSSAAADCRVDMQELAERFDVPDSVRLQEAYYRDRSAEDPPHLFLYCAVCQSQLWVVHPREASADTPAFPA